MQTFPEYEQYDALGLAKLIRNGEISALEAVEAAIERIEARNPKVNAVIHHMHEKGLSAALAAESIPDGPFTGVPFLIKDLSMPMAGEPMTNGSRFFKEFVPQADSNLVKRFKESGVITLGRTNVPEFGVVPFTEPELFGPTHNPWDLTRTPGGSSGGSAAAVAAGMVPIASASDGGGSIRVPASCCGIFGIKPSRGRNPVGPFVGEVWEGFSIEHIVSRSVRDSAAMLDATNGPDAGAPYFLTKPDTPFLDEVARDPKRLRIAFTAEPFFGEEAAHPDCLQGMHETVALLESLGHHVEEATPPIHRSRLTQAFSAMIMAQTRASIVESNFLLQRKATLADYEPATWALATAGKALRSQWYVMAMNEMQRQAREVGHWFEGYDVLLTPTLSTPPFVTGTLQPPSAERLAAQITNRLGAGLLTLGSGYIQKASQRIFNYIAYLPLFNLTGQPAMSVPLYWNEAGLPIGMQFVAKLGDDSTLFNLAGQLERARPWFDRRPPHIS